MSSPALPYPQGAPLLTPAELQKFEGPLIAMAQQANGSLPKLLTAFFSFLHRRTDFYCILPEDNNVGTGVGRNNVGFKEGQAEQILLASFRQFPLRRVGPPPKSGTIPSPKEVVSNNSGASKVATKETVVEESEKEKAESESHKGKKSAAVDDGKAKDDPGKEVNEKTTSNNIATKPASIKGSNTTETTVRYTDDGKQIPIGNGGSTSRYVWTQTLEEVTVHCPIPTGTRAKELTVKIDAHSISIKRKDGNHASFPPLEGMFFARIRPDECTWTIESSDESQSMTTLQLTLDKIQKTWWDIVLSGDNPLIDTTMVDSSRHIETYDERTQAQIRRIIHDQRQERLGLGPPSDKKLMTTSSKEGGGKIPPLPSGVEYIDGETLDKATIRN